MISRRFIKGIVLAISLFAFEVFNYDTTHMALVNWFAQANPASVNKIVWAFCLLDLMRLTQFFGIKHSAFIQKIWLFGVGVNALFTWYNARMTVWQYDFGHVVLRRQQVVLYVPIFIALLVFLTRVLFVEALVATIQKRVPPVRTAQSSRIAS